MLYRRIRELREDMDLTQAKLCEFLHCSQRVYSNYERGERDIPTEILILIANYYNVSVDYLLGRTDNKANPNCRVKIGDRPRPEQLPAPRTHKRKAPAAASTGRS